MYLSFGVEGCLEEMEWEGGWVMESDVLEMFVYMTRTRVVRAGSGNTCFLWYIM